jgi:hypothetical protein
VNNNNADTNDPSVWFLLLERGKRTGDFELAARAKRELARLGVIVTYRRPKTPKGQEAGHAR